ncbi:MAG: methyltransferase [Candidatus Cloacimonadaceae bacterium]
MRVLDLGSGCGIVAIMLALQRPQWQVEGLEIQSGLNSLAQSNAALCGLKITFREGDLCSFQAPERYDLIVSNPPWLLSGSGKSSPSAARNHSRIELLCRLEDVLGCLKRNLAPGGNALLLYPHSRAADLQTGAAKTLLDIISLSPAAGLKKHTICHIRHKGL